MEYVAVLQEHYVPVSHASLPLLRTQWHFDSLYFDVNQRVILITQGRFTGMRKGLCLRALTFYGNVQIYHGHYIEIFTSFSYKICTKVLQLA